MDMGIISILHLELEILSEDLLEVGSMAPVQEHIIPTVLRARTPQEDLLQQLHLLPSIITEEHILQVHGLVQPVPHARHQHELQHQLQEHLELIPIQEVLETQELANQQSEQIQGQLNEVDLATKPEFAPLPEQELRLHPKGILLKEVIHQREVVQVP